MLCTLAAVCMLLLPFYTKRANASSAQFIFFSCLALIACTCIGIYSYYLSILTPFMVFLFIPLFSYINASSIQACVVFIILLVIQTHFNYFVPNKEHKLAAKKAYSQNNMDYKKVERYIASVPGAKLMYLESLGMGFGIRTGAVPACPSWFHLNYSGTEEIEDRLEVIQNKIPDFIVTWKRSQYDSILSRSGYEPQIEFLDGERLKYTLVLWGRKRPHN